MKRIAQMLLVALGSLSLIISCGVEPQKLDSTQSALRADHQDRGNNKDNQTKKCKKKRYRFRESFETYEIGAEVPDSYIWVKNGATQTEITDQTPARGKQSLKVEITEDSAERDYIGIKFCLNTSVSNVLVGSFYIKLHTLVNWTGLGVVSDEDNMLYWWWIREDGTVFNGQTFDSFMENVWHRVKIKINRTKNTAIFSLDGNKTFFDLNLEWTNTDPNQPMQCLFTFMGVYDIPQIVQIDHVKVRGY